MSTNLVRDWNKNTEPRGGKMGVVQVLHVYHRRNNDSTTQGFRAYIPFFFRHFNFSE